MKVKCFDLVSEIIDEATSRFEDVKANNEGFEFIKRACSYFDEFADEYEGVSFGAEVDSVTSDISITLECPIIMVKSRTHKFFILMQHAKSVEFYAKKDLLGVTFTFPGIWENK